jgi:hypothetical protein
LLPPLHATLVDEGVVAIAVGSVMVNERDDVHALLSVMVQVYVPAVNPVFDELVPPFDHK